MMRHSMTGSRNVQPNGVAALRRLTFRRVSSLLAVVGVLAVGPVFAKDPAATEVKPTNKATAIHAKAHSESAAIPECLEKLKLSAQQQDQIKEIIRNYDGSIGVVWKQFSDRYMQAICMEVRRRNCGVNGKPILFYAARHPLGQQPRSVKKPKAEPKQKGQYLDLLDGLRSLGLEVTATVVEPVVKELFPAGIQNLDCGEVIRGVFLRMKRQNSTDKVGR